MMTGFILKREGLEIIECPLSEETSENMLIDWHYHEGNFDLLSPYKKIREIVKELKPRFLFGNPE